MSHHRSALRYGTAIALIMVSLTMLPPARAANVVSLTYYYPIGVAGPLAKIMSGLVDDFNTAHPGIHVTPVFAGSYQQTLAKIETGLQSGTPPDVAVLNATALFDLLHLQAIQPVDSLVSAGDFYPAFLANAHAQGHYWSVPFQRSTVVLYYNATAFAQAGIKHAPTTWAELVRDAQALTTSNRYGIEIPSSGTSYWLFAPFSVEGGSDLTSPDGTKAYFNTPAALNALSFWYKLAHTYKAMPSGVINWLTAPTDFEAGHAAMIVHSSGSLAAILKGSSFKVGVAFMPSSTHQGTVTGGGSFYLFKGLSAEKQAAVITFVKWMTSPTIAARWSIATGYVGVSPRVYQTSIMKAYVATHPQALVAARQLAIAHAEPSTYQLNQIYDVIDAAIQSVIDGQAQPSAALSAAQKQADQILAPFAH